MSRLDNQIAIDAAGRLLTVVTSIADMHAGLMERRLAVLMAVADIIQADTGVWAWGRGWPNSSSVVPVAHLNFGVDHRQRMLLMEWGISTETDRTFRQPILKQMGTARSVTTLWRDIFTEQQWNKTPYMRSQLVQGGWSCWLHSVQYSDHDTWSNFFLLRNHGKPDFDEPDAVIVDLALKSIPWLHSTAEEVLKPETFAGLTPRQRTVMLMLLDGLPRKTVAARLEITEDTVGDHIKSIYSHFGVGSSSELAALFLKAR